MRLWVPLRTVDERDEPKCRVLFSFFFSCSTQIFKTTSGFTTQEVINHELSARGETTPSSLCC